MINNLYQIEGFHKSSSLLSTNESTVTTIHLNFFGPQPHLLSVVVLEVVCHAAFRLLQLDPVVVHDVRQHALVVPGLGLFRVQIDTVPVADLIFHGHWRDKKERKGKNGLINFANHSGTIYPASPLFRPIRFP